jgi:glutathione S-transferase
MITLHQPPPVWGLPNMSPFCVKLETYLRMAGIEYKVGSVNFKHAPKDKVPYITDGDRVMGDTGFIVDYLKEKYGDKLDAKLSAEDQAKSLVMRRMIEEHQYFVGAWLRWHEKESFVYVAAVFKRMLPPVIGGFILKKIRESFLGEIKAQGVGRHTREEIIQLARDNLSAISILLGDKSFYLGNEPTSVDATLYGFLIQVLWTPWDSPVKTYAQSLPNLNAYCERMKNRYWQ